MTKKIIHIFKNDLRLSDNPAFTEASKSGHIIPIYIVDDSDLNHDSAQNWWLQKSLEKLKKSLDDNLYFFRGDYKEIITSIISENDVQAVYWNRSYDPYSIQRDKDLKSYLIEKSIEVKTFNSLLLWEPWQVSKPDGSPYRVFSPFYRKGCLNQEEPRFPLPQPNKINYFKIKGSMDVKSLNLLTGFKWYDKLNEHWDIGEKAAQKKLSVFLEDGIDNYKDGRNFPSKKNVSRLSPHIRFGEISPNQIWYAARSLKEDRNIDHFCSELGWREFSYYLLYHFPFIEKENLNKKFDNFPWTNNLEYLKAWQKGLTGYPIIDAGMREFGKGLVLEPYLPTVLLFGGLINSAGNEEQCSNLLPKIIEGDLLGAFAYLERQSRYELTDVMTKVESCSEGFILAQYAKQAALDVTVYVLYEIGRASCRERV